jgi:hypothetical protein
MGLKSEYISTTEAIKLAKSVDGHSLSRPTLISWCVRYQLGYQRGPKKGPGKGRQGRGGKWLVNKELFLDFLRTNGKSKENSGV